MQEESTVTLSSDELSKMNDYWHASLYLCVGMLHLQDNPQKSR